MHGVTYNSWSNYETWCVAQWLISDELLSRYVHWIVLEHNRDVHEVAKGIEEFVNALRKEEEPFRYKAFDDLLTNELQTVNWHEIAAGVCAE